MYIDEWKKQKNLYAPVAVKYPNSVVKNSHLATLAGYTAERNSQDSNLYLLLWCIQNHVCLVDIKLNM